jgi:G3E family GTPase
VLIYNLANIRMTINNSSILTPVNIITGFLGAGKTTIIMHLLAQIEDPGKVVWLKNEYGNVNVDSLLLQQTNVIPKEILNGCLCCVLVGRLEAALLEIMRDYAPERIIIETSGTAWPGPIVREVERLENFYVDSVAYVVDCINFSGFDDHSYVSKLETSHVDLVILNKYPVEGSLSQEAENVFQKQLDDVYSVFPSTVKATSVDGNLPKEKLVNLNTSKRKLSSSYSEEALNLKGDHPDEVKTIEIDVNSTIKLTRLTELLLDLSKIGVIRVKGIIQEDHNYFVVNSVFGATRYTLQPNFTGKSQLVLFSKDENITKEMILSKLQQL